MSEQKPEISIILPSYLEEENLRLLLPRLSRQLKELTSHFEVLVVDTLEPMDKTREVALENEAKYINRVNGNTFGDAVRTGISHSKGTYIVFMDADGSHPPEFIQELFTRRGLDRIVVASRYVEGGITENSWLLTWMSRILNFTYSFVLNLPCQDVSNSFKLYPGDLVRSLHLVCSNFDIVEELLYKAYRKSKPEIIEVPFAFKKRMFGETKRNLFLFILTYIFTMLKLRFMRR